jgi:hypothetical protein
LANRPYTSHTGTSHWQPPLDESYIDNVKEREGGDREREREKEKERIKGTNK